MRNETVAMVLNPILPGGWAMGALHFPLNLAFRELSWYAQLVELEVEPSSRSALLEISIFVERSM